MGLQYFPDDLLICILKRLPVKILMKFLCVSKSWYSLITNPYFINWPLSDWTKLALPWNETSLVAGTCNGLICFVNGSNYHSFCVWNPSIRKCIHVESVSNNSWNNHRFFGFGFDSLTNDYKVVAVIYRSKLRSPYAQCYSINAGRWRDVELPHFRRDGYHDFCIYGECFSNGVIHWILKYINIDVECGLCSVLTFDVHNEDFGGLRLPPELANRYDTGLCLAVIDNLFSVIDVTHDYTYCVWQMKDYGVQESWMLLYRIKLDGQRYSWKPSFWDKVAGKVFIFCCSNGGSSSVVYGDNVSFCFNIFSYTESLVLLDKRNQLQPLSMNMNPS